MAFTGLLALLDDISVLADDVATLTYAASKKTTGLVTDDMAVTAEQALGLRKERELAVVWKVAMGSLFNKGVILVPAALVLNVVAPWLLTPILMVGGAYLSFEGVEKITHKLLHPHEEEKPKAEAPPVDPETFEQQRVRGAIRTDLILSAEIVAISLGVVAAESLGMQIAVLYAIALIMTVGVYGIVAVLVRLDDIGAAMVQADAGFVGLGRALLAGTPWLLKVISWIGTIAMLLVGGHILVHGVPPLEHAIHEFAHGLHLPGWLEGLVVQLADFGVGLVVGGILVGIYELVTRGSDANAANEGH